MPVTTEFSVQVFGDGGSWAVSAASAKEATTLARSMLSSTVIGTAALCRTRNEEGALSAVTLLKAFGSIPRGWTDTLLDETL